MSAFAVLNLVSSAQVYDIDVKKRSNKNKKNVKNVKRKKIKKNVCKRNKNVTSS